MAKARLAVLGSFPNPEERRSRSVNQPAILSGVSEPGEARVEFIDWSARRSEIKGIFGRIGLFVGANCRMDALSCDGVSSGRYHPQWGGIARHDQHPARTAAG
jgi:hypothetical protein